MATFFIIFFKDHFYRRDFLQYMLETKLKSELEKMRLLELQLFVIEFGRASQLGRSISKNKRKPKSGFREALVKTCLSLIKEMDDNELSNVIIRREIKKLSMKYDVSYGQAQKVVNVCLKQYMFLTQKYEFAKELDCPLDSTTMSGYKIFHNKMCSVDESDYKQYQNLFDQSHNPRILKDEIYDTQRICNYTARKK